ncbi:MAG: adenosylcobinamide-GDP ribazoletransferase [Desulfobacterota bacterium]|nr:adenosylcobinamide-GDP ribazoletransferase [Thermodesulfobacteriota bacterium]
MFRAILTAFRTLTIIPVPGKDTENFSRSLCFFPLVGAVLGFVVLFLHHGAEAIGFNDPFVLALLSMAFVTWLTGGLHIDGLGDVADAFGGGKNKEHILQLLKDPAMGSFGVCSIVFDILIKAACWQFFFEIGNPWFIFWSVVFSRAMQGLAIAFIPNARAESIAAPFGQGGNFAKTSVILAYLFAALAAVWLLSFPVALACALSSLGAASLFLFYCLRKLQGITGDCVGATNEIAEISVLLGGMILVNGVLG